MDEKKQATNAPDAPEIPDEPVQPITQEQAEGVAGGDGSCSTSTITIGDVTVTSTGNLTDVAKGAYDAAIDTTSYAIERVVKSF